MVTLLVISVILVGTTSFISLLGYSSYVRNAIGVVLTPIQKGADSLFDKIESFFVTDADYEALKKENEELKLQINENEKIIAEAEIALRENEELKDYLGLKDEHTDFIFVDAEVIGKNAGNHTTVITLNRGSFHGIEPDMPVVDKFGLVGYVSEVGLNWSKVLTVLNADSSVGVCVERNAKEGMLDGKFGLYEEGICMMRFLTAECDVEVGDRIFTSSASDKYPGGIFVGTVTKVETDSVSRETVAYIDPIAQLDKNEQVMIITEFEKKYE